MKVISFKVDEDLLYLLNWYASAHNMSRSEVIRKAIERFLKEELKEEAVPPARIEKPKVKI